RRLGHGLTEFLIEHNISVLCCVPTLLATIDRDVPSLRSLLVGGEACPGDLVRRWSRPGRRMLNTYGPTEATVTAIWCELFPDRTVTIGTPLPTYRVYILDDQLRPIKEGESGEICIGGPGVAIGYLNRPDLTEDRFVPNPVRSDWRDAPRLYRTGDLGRYTSSGEIEYLGRIDTQVKIRGYRIELGEIEEVIREDQTVENAVVKPLEIEGVVQDLVAYVTLHEHNEAVDSDLRERLHASLRSRLPAYMVPSFIEVLKDFPLLAADKVNRAALPPPASARLSIRTMPHVAPVTPLESQLAAAWGQVLGYESVSVEDDFFRDFGGHSLAAARVISRLRQEPELQALAIGDLYNYPTIRSLAQFIEDVRSQAADEQPADSLKPAPRQHSTLRVLGCGIAQLVLHYAEMLLLSIPALGLFYAVILLLRLNLTGLPLAGLPEVIRDLPPPSILELLIGAVAAWFGITTFLLPVVGGRLLMHGVRPGWYPLWGVTYLRWWLYSKILTFSPLGAPSPLGLFVSSPLLPPYLRMLGARIGRDCQLGSASIGLPMFIDIDDGVSIGHEVELQPYIVEGGWLRLAPIRLGRGSFLGTNSVVLAGAQIGSEATVAEQSLVHADHVIPANEHWGGSPIKRLEAAPPLLGTMAAKAYDGRWPVWMLVGFSVGTLVLMLLPWLMMAPSTVFVAAITLSEGLGWGIASTALAGPIFVFSTCVLVLIGKRAVLPVVHAGLYPLRSGFWLRKWFSDQLMSLSLGMTNQLYATLYVVPFLRLLGARIGRWSEISTVGLIDPDMLILGDESFVADIAVIGSAVFYRGCVSLAPAQVGRRSFVGNGALVPGSSYLGDNSLLGVHSVPPARQIDPGTSWLGSPAIFLPRRQASQNFEENITYRPRPSLVAWRLVIEFLRVTLPPSMLALALLIGVYIMYLLAQVLSPIELLVLIPALAMGIGMAATLVVALLKWLIVGRYRARVEPLWSLFVRRTELVTGLYESLAVLVLVGGLAGTPWIAPLLRLFGARIGRRVWLATTYLTEFDLVEVGDDAAVSEATSLQTHLFEDRVMKMSTVKIGADSSIGSRSVVLYDTEVGESASLDALSLVMKGESLPARSHWRGIPARAS
ncbi:MAG: peptide synthetase, partial [Chloroflexi bacterium]